MTEARTSRAPGRRARFTRVLAHGLGAAAILAGTQAALAQIVPPSAEPGRIEQRFERRPAPQVSPEMVVPAPDGAKPPPEAAQIRFLLKQIEIDGGTVYPADALAPLYRALLNTQVSLADIYAVAERITAKYRADGYVLARAVVPAQRISDGTVRITIVEGFVSRVLFDGPANDLMRRYAEKIKASQPLRFADLERYLLLMNDVPGTIARGVFAPSPDVPGGSDLTIFTEKRVVDGFVSMDNRGTRYTGPFEILAGAGLNDAAGLGERLTLRYVTATQTDEIQYGEVSGDFAISSEGTRLQIVASRSNTHPGYTLKPFDVKGFGTTVTARVVHPVIRSREHNLNLAGSFTARDVEQKILGTQSFDDRLRILRAEASYDMLDAWDGINLIAAEVSQGLDAFGARESGSDFLSRANGRSDFTKVTGQVSRLQRLTRNVNLLVAFAGQKSANQALLASEEFALGGAEFGRAYDPAEITGDDGWAGRAELQINDPLPLPEPVSYQLYAFYDGGVVYNNDPGSSGSDSLVSAGFGVRANLTSWMSGLVELAVPLTRGVSAVSVNPDEQNDPRVFFALAARF